MTCHVWYEGNFLKSLTEGEGKEEGENGIFLSSTLASAFILKTECKEKEIVWQIF